MGESFMTTLRRALALGVAFGLAAATVETCLNLIPLVERRFGPGPLFSLRVAALQMLLGALLGLAAAPLLRVRAGALLHVVALGVAWWGLERWVAVDSPIFAQLELLPPGVGALLVLLGLWLARRRPRLPWAIGVAALAAAIAAPQLYLRATTPPEPPRAALPPARPGAPDVVLVVLDTVRAGSVSAYGYERPTSPEFDALAREGALFLDATSPSTWSLPSHASLFTGRYPSSHGAHGEHRFLDGRFPTLAEVLAHHGYETFCFTSNAWISDGLGLTRGFAWQDGSWRDGRGPGLGFSFVHRLLDRLGLQEGDKGGGVVASHFEAWARARPASAPPAFAFLNFIEAHFPYHQLPHEYLWRFHERPYAELRSISLELLGMQFGGRGRPPEASGPAARDMYDGGVAYTSHLLQRVVEALRARGTLDRTLLVVLADHGEILGEREGFFGHGPSLYQEAVGVPLLVRHPTRIPAGVRVNEPVSTVGVFATILDLAEIDRLPTLQVGSLAPLARGARDGGGPILSELHEMQAMVEGVPRADPQMQADRRYRLLREGSFKLVETSKGEAFLYDLAADPRETRDLAAERPAELARLRARMEEVRAGLALPALDAPLAVGAEAPELDEATREQLRALGYAE
jgi:arylsulfatase A-like enzyme